MTDAFELKAQKRADVGKGASRRLRRNDDMIPAIIYGGDKDNVELIMLEQRHVRKARENEAFYSHILTLNIDGTKEEVVLKDMQRHEVKNVVMHMDFQRISKTKKLHLRVPLHFLGEEAAPGVKQGGIVSHEMTDVEVSCLATDLPEYLEIDVSTLELDHAVHLSDIKLPKGVEIVALSHEGDHNQPVASIHKPRAAIESENAAADEEKNADEANK